MPMGGELVLVQKDRAVVAAAEEQRLPALVERAGGAARFAWDEFFYAEHHNKHTQRAYQAAVRRFLAWCEEERVELASISPGLVGQYLVALGGSPSKRTSTWRRSGASSTGWCSGMSSCSTRRHRSAASRSR